MPPRSIWRGAISFGMVSIPVKLFTATESKDISFRQLHRDDNARIRQLRWCSVEDQEVPYDEIVRGYEYAKDRYVVLDEDDFEKLPLVSKHTIELTAFVNADEIDPIYYEKGYYLEADEAGLKPFALLIRALEEKGLTAIAQIAIRNKEQLCALRPFEGRILLETLHYPDELRIRGLEPAESVEASDAEMEMAFTLIEMLEQPFAPEQYSDEYRAALMTIIDAKLEGQEVVEAEEPATSKVIDLMSALKASVEATKARQEDAPSKRGGGRRRKAAAS